ncbi:MAG TPA: mechanosensitive ion channel [Promineifilum sp.]|nr:mechanosensitive ion channel [Promineifilum sp.]
MLNDIRTFLEDFSRRLLTVDSLLQVGLFAGILLIALATRNLLRRQVERVEARLRQVGIVAEQFPWSVDLLVALGASIFPLVVWLLCTIAAGALTSAERPADVLAWLAPIFGLVGVYRFVGTIMTLNLSAERARTWRYQILRPLIAVLLFLHITGMLDNLMGLRLNPGQGVLVTLQSALMAVAALIFFFWLSRIIRRFLAETALPRAGVEPAVNQVISTFSGYALVIAGFLVALSVMGINITTLTVIAGGVSVGIGFGLQELINNFVSGFILLTERSLAPGDVIEVDGNMGRVQQIGLRTMQITTPDDVELIIPNGYLLSSTVTSYTHKSPEMRVHIKLPAAAEVHPRTVQETLLEAARTHSEVLAEPGPTALVVDFEDQVIRYDLQFWIQNPIRAPFITSDVRVRIWELFAERGIEMDVPQDVLLVKSSEQGD